MDQDERDFAEWVGKQVSAFFVVLLLAFFAYGFLGRFFG